MQLKDRFAWILVTASALAAMVAGHAIELWLENTHVLGEGAAGYQHVAQSTVAEAAVVLFLLVAAALLQRVAACALRRRPTGDCVLPALSAIAQAGFTRIAPRLAGLQLLALFAAEIGEQRLTGYQGNALAAIAGHGHGTALAVHFLMAALVTFALCRVAKFAAARSEAFVDAVITLLRRALIDLLSTGKMERNFTPAPILCGRGSALLSLGLANRPPPAFATFA
jgi:hypothetical protein